MPKAIAYTTREGGEWVAIPKDIWITSRELNYEIMGERMFEILNDLTNTLNSRPMALLFDSNEIYDCIIQQWRPGYGAKVNSHSRAR